jgi:hypothetical protein
LDDLGAVSSTLGFYFDDTGWLPCSSTLGFYFDDTMSIPLCGQIHQEARKSTECFVVSRRRLYFTEPTDNHRLYGDTWIQWTGVLPLSWSDGGLWTSSWPWGTSFTCPRFYVLGVFRSDSRSIQCNPRLPSEELTFLYYHWSPMTYQNTIPSSSLSTMIFSVNIQNESINREVRPSLEYSLKRFTQIFSTWGFELFCCLLWINKVRVKEKIWVWISRWQCLGYMSMNFSVTVFRFFCLLWIKKTVVKEKTYIWVSVWWKTEN